MSRSGIEAYWLASRNRLDAWAVDLKRLETYAANHWDCGQFEVEPKVWEATAALNEEIMVSEILTRIWTVVGSALDERSQTNESGPFLRSVYHSHLEARHRVMRLIFEKMTPSVTQARRADRVRGHAERWTDILLGFLDSSCPIDEFAFESDRVADFGVSLCSHHAPAMAQSLIMLSLRSTFEVGFVDRCPNPEMNERIACSVLGCFGPDVFDSIGLFKSLWQSRLANTARDTQGMLDSLIAEHESVGRHALPKSRMI